MLKLEFNIFQNKLKEDQLVGHYSTVHCMIDELGFTFIMHSKERWKYYTIMSFDMINRYSIETDIDPIEAFDMFIINYCSNTLKIEAPEQKQIMSEIEFEEPKEEISKDNIHLSPDQSNLERHPPITLSKDNVIDPGKDLVNEAKDYSDFLLKFFDRLEKGVLNNISQINDELDKSFTEKTLGAFLRSLFNIVNTVYFANKVKGFLKMDLINGLLSAEEELNMDIGFTGTFEDKLNQLASQQIDGYTINGKKWPGIKGVTKEIQSNVIKTVQSGINEKLTLNDIKENIQKDFSSFSDWRSEMIARTETTRVTSEGKLLGYKESGIKGKKVWSTAIDNRTSPICKRLNGQSVELDGSFIDPETRKEFSTPPAHVNCRSSIFFKPN